MDTTRQRVLQCVLDLHNARRPISRQLIAEHVREKLSVVDEAVKRLKEDGLVRTVVPGILEPVAQFPPDEPISRTTLPDGRTKIEKGDQMMELTPHETQVLGKMLQGDAMEMAYWYAEREQGAHLVRLEAEIRRLHGTVTQLRHRVGWTRRQSSQGDLFTEPETPQRRRPAPAQRRSIREPA